MAPGACLLPWWIDLPRPVKLANGSSRRMASRRPPHESLNMLRPVRCYYIQIASLAILCTVGPLALPSSAFAEDAKTKPFGLQQRTPWTTSNFRGRPEPPPPYRAERLYSKLRFSHTTVISSAPGTDRLFVGERDGKIYSMPRQSDLAAADLFLDARELIERLNVDRKQPLGLESLYGLTFDPDFVNNRFCYVCYVVKQRDGGQNQIDDGTRVVRLTVSKSDPPKCDIASEKLIIAWLQGGHNGGCLKFGHDGCLYISSGDGGFAFPPDGLKSGQDMTTLLSKVLRIDVRREENGRPYAIPADNPFVSLDKARGETWSYGMRNPWKMSFDRKTGDLWVGDVGWELWELVYRVSKGDNFGWSIVEGSQPVHTEGKRGPTPIVPATMEIPHTDGASITGGVVYRGKKLPELEGVYVFGDWETRRGGGAKVTDAGLGERVELIDPTVRIVDFAEDNDGELYLLDHEDGSIYTLVRNVVSSQGNPFPRKLSETGIFRSAVTHEAAAGVLPFSINCEQWSDHATAQRFIGVPGTGAIQVRSRPKVVPGSQFSRATDFPLDTVLVKTLSLDLVEGDPSTRRRVETQVLHYDGREWQGYAYEWNDDQTDASLVDRAGKNRVFKVADSQSPGGHRTQTWRFASRGECIRCHNPWSEYALAFNMPQLNRLHDYGHGSDNQIRTLRHIGLIQDVVDPPDPLDPVATLEPIKSHDALPHLSNPYDSAGDINARARSYLHVNCGHCHRFNGGGSSYIYLQHDLPLKDVKALGVRPTQGTFGIHEAQILAAGDPYRSVLYFRLAKTGPGHMPHLGTKIVDERGLAVIHDWIRQLPLRLEETNKVEQLIGLDEATVLARERSETPLQRWQLTLRLASKQNREQPNDVDREAAAKQIEEQTAERLKQRASQRRKLTDELLASPAQAMLLAVAMRQDRMPESIRELVLKAALARTDPAVRDLFEVFIPDEQRTQRLGDVINPAEILKLTGDRERGRTLFHESTVVQCRNCHRIAGKGNELGPDLGEIGKKNDRAKLLEGILQPSLKVDPKYQAWLVETKSGLVHSGLLVKKDDVEIVLRDVQNKLQRVAAGDVEGMFPQQKSLMPDLLLKEFTAQQVADLLEYLGSVK